MHHLNLQLAWQVAPLQGCAYSTTEHVVHASQGTLDVRFEHAAQQRHVERTFKLPYHACPSNAAQLWPSAVCPRTRSCYSPMILNTPCIGGFGASHVPH